MIAPVSYIQPLTILRRKRMLPVEGEVLANVGDTVHSGDAVARAHLQAKHFILDAGRALGLPPERAKKLILRKVGDQVEEGAIIAGRRGMGARQLRAPAAGTIAAISESQVLLQMNDDSSLLQARVPGVVIEIDPNRGVTIECICALVQGVWGNGRLADGLLHVVGTGPGQVLTADQIDMSLRGVLLFVGRCEQRQALDLAAQVPIRGLIVGSLATRLQPIAKNLPYPIVTIEGFGSTPMNTDAFKLLSNHEGEQATLNAQAFETSAWGRPEVIIPIKDAGKPPQQVSVQSFQVGQTVRVLNGPDKALVGEIAALLPSTIAYPSGLRAASAEVRLETGFVTNYPLANLDLLG
jgi:hypothetical protein